MCFPQELGLPLAATLTQCCRALATQTRLNSIAKLVGLLGGQVG